MVTHILAQQNGTGMYGLNWHQSGNRWLIIALLAFSYHSKGAQDDLATDVGRIIILINRGFILIDCYKIANCFYKWGLVTSYIIYYSQIDLLDPLVGNN